MICIGFSTQTHRLYARILCRHFRHVAPILITKNKCIIYQFTERNKITLICIRHKDLHILETYGWKFIKYKCKFTPRHALQTKPINCVQWTKRACGINKRYILTPDALFRYLKDEQKCPYWELYLNEN